MTHAANMLSNFRGIAYTSRLYEKMRLEHRDFISKNNTGRKRTEAQKLKMSSDRKGMIIVYDDREEEKIYFRISKADPAYNPKHHIFYRKGYTHTEDTKQKIGRPGKLSYYNPETSELKFLLPLETVPDGFILGYPPNALSGGHVIGTIWVHDPQTKKNIRVHEESEIPTGYIKGRYFESNPGFDKANSMTNVVNFHNKTVEKVLEIDKEIHGPESGANSFNTLIFIFDNKIFTSYKKMLDYTSKMGYYIRKPRKTKAKFLEHVVVPQPHHNSKENDFRQKHKGKTYSQLGLRVYSLCEFDIQQHKEKEIIWN